MEAIREMRVVKDNKIIIELPASFDRAQVEVVVLRIASDNTINSAPATKRRTPSPMLAGTRIVGDIMSPVVADPDWEALS